MLNILITGASGFVGQKLVQHLNRNFDNIRIWNLGRTPIEGTQFIDISDFERSFHDYRFDYIVHTLASVGEKFCEDFFLTDTINIGTTKSILRYLSLNRQTRLIYLSSIILYSNTNTPPVKEDAEINFFYTNYSFTKGISEEYVRYLTKRLELNSIILRVSNIYGPGQKFVNSPYIIPEKIMQGLTEGKVEVRNENTKRDYIYIDDLVELITKIIFEIDVQGVYNVGLGKPVSAGEIGRIISSELGIEFSSLNLPVTGPQNFYADITEIYKVIGWKPKTDIGEGIRNTISYIQTKLGKLQ